MTALSLKEAPSQLKEGAQHVWLHGITTDPACGDLWLLSSDGEALGLVVVGSVYPGFVRAWPVTLQSPGTNDVAVELSSRHFTTPLALWPHMETGLGLHLLDRKIDDVLSSKQVQLLRRFAYDDQPCPLPLLSDCTPGPETVTQRELIGLFERLCFMEWPVNRPGEAVLAREVLADRGRTAHDIAAVLNLDPAESLALWTGKKAVDKLALERLHSEFGLPADEMLKVPSGPEVREIQRPEYKKSLLQLAKRRGITENQSRNAAREEFALAARNTGSSKSLSSRVRSALDRLLGERDEAT